MELRQASEGNEMNAELNIWVKIGTEDTMVLFPFQSGQFVDHVWESDDEADLEIITVDLGSAIDTTAAQEQHLNTNTDVVRYDIS